MPADPLPNFLIIGAQRCGTRWLRTNLIAHPDVFAPPFDLNFFSDSHRVRRGGEAAYRALFTAWEGEPCVGESSPAYLLWQSNPRLVAERIKAMLPDVRLIALVRDPVDRMYSAMLQYVRTGRLAPDTDLFALVQGEHPSVAELDLVDGGRYAESLYTFSRLFGEQLLVLVLDDVRDQPAKVYEAALRHIGADPDFVPAHLERVLFSNRRTVRVTGPRLSNEQRRILYSLYRDDVEELEAMIGADLSRWDPGPSPGRP